jgi:RNA polymerase sigma-70 factor (ECF subfamily)
MRTHHTWDWNDVHRLALGETRRVLGAGQDAEDAAQDAAIRAWRRRATCHGAPAAWVRTIAHNEALRVAGRRRDEVPLDDEAAPLACEAHGTGDAHDVRVAIRALEASDRLLLLLRYWGDLTQPEVARATSLPEGTVKVRLHRARERLRMALSAA